MANLRFAFGINLHVVQTHRKSKSAWIEVGEYMGERLQTQDRSEATALKRWAEAAKYKGG